MIKLLFTLFFLTSSSFAEVPIRVSIIDTGLDLTDPRFSELLCENGKSSIDLTNTTIKDVEGHGTHVAGLIKKYAQDSNYCLIIIKFYTYNSDGSNARRFREAIRIAEYQNSIFVNISGGGRNFDEKEKDLFKSRSDITFIVAAGNDGVDLSSNNCYYPACYDLPNIIVVGSLGKNNKRASSSNKGSRISAWEIGENVTSTLPNNMYGEMSGTSMACAIHTGKLIYGRNH